MRNKLFTKEVDKLLFKQFPLGSDLDNQVVVAKIFNPYGRGTWYVINSDPNDPDYLWCIVNFYELEMGSVSRKELEDIRINVYGHKFPLERDLGFSPVNASKLFSDILSGAAYYAKGGIAKKKNEVENQWVVYDSDTSEILATKSTNRAAKMQMMKLFKTGKYNSLTCEQKSEYDKFHTSNVSEFALGGKISYKDGNFYQEQTIELDDTRYTIKIKRGKSKGFDAYTTISLTFDDYKTGNAPKTRTIEFIPDELMPEMVFAATELLEVANQSSSSKNIKKIFSKKIESKLMINGHKELYTIDYSFKHDNKRGAIALYRQKESDSSFDSSFDLSNALPFMPIDVIEAVAQMFQNVQDFILEGSPGN